MSFKIIPYRQGSRSASELAGSLSGRVLRLEGSRYRHRRQDVIINWGNTNDSPLHRVALNGRSLRLATNKLEFFRTVHRSHPSIIPEFWEHGSAIPDSAFTNHPRNPSIVCRTNLAGHSGEGIVLANSRQELVQSNLYTKYIPKREEYRIHVGRLVIDEETEKTSVVISQQQKRRNTDVESPNWQVRNLAGGFVYARTDVNPPRDLVDMAIRAFDCFDLDFGAVDCIVGRDGRSYVLEINTAPGLTGTTLEDYSTFFREFERY